MAQLVAHQGGGVSARENRKIDFGTGDVSGDTGPMNLQNRLSSPHWLILGAGAALVAACGGATPPAEEPASTEPEPASESEGTTKAESVTEDPSEGHKPFHDMTAPEKMKHMKTVVAPTMAKVFKEADAEAYANFSCTNCHGSGAKQGNFSMPTADLPALNKEEMDKHPEVTKFMMERVVPEMAKALGEAPYDPATGSGFGCFGCHTKKE